MSEYNCTPGSFRNVLMDSSPGDVLHVGPGVYQGQWKILSWFNGGTKENPIIIDFDNVTLDATGIGGSGFVFSGNGEPIYITIRGRLTIKGGTNPFYGSRSDVRCEGKIYIVNSDTADGWKGCGDMAVSSDLWYCQGWYIEHLDITGARKEAIDLTGWRNTHIVNLDIHNTICDNGVLWKNMAENVVTDHLLIWMCGLKYSAVAEGGSCINSVASRFEAKDCTIKELVMEDVTAMNGVTFTSAKDCHVFGAVATNCIFSNGAVAAGESVAYAEPSKQQRPSEGCTVNGVAWTANSSPWLDFPPVPVEEPPAPPAVVPLTREEVQAMIEERVKSSEETTDWAMKELAERVETKSSLNHTHKLSCVATQSIGPAVEPTE